MANHARLLIELLATNEVRWRARHCAASSGRPGEGLRRRRGDRRLPGRRRTWLNRCERSLETEQPDAVAACRSDQSVAGRECEHVLFALVLERTHRRMHTSTGLEFPELLAR